MWKDKPTAQNPRALCTDILQISIGFLFEYIPEIHYKIYVQDEQITDKDYILPRDKFNQYKVQ